MAATVSRRRGRKARPDVLQKPRGVIHPRVQKVGPEHFGIVAVDCAKARSKWMLSDFYGKVLVQPTIVEHDRAGFEAAIAALRGVMKESDIRDLIVALERTGRDHHPPARAFAAGGFETRTVHPFTTKQFRQPADPGNKTDDTDLAAISRAAINGFALIEPKLDEFWWQFQLLTRHRRDLVGKASILCCQIKEHLDAALPPAFCLDADRRQSGGLQSLFFNPGVEVAPGQDRSPADPRAHRHALQPHQLPDGRRRQGL